MAFNRNILYVPTRSDVIRRFDLQQDPLAPVALSDITLGLDVEIVSLALFSNGDLILSDVKNGRLIRIDPTGSVTYNIDSRASTEAPNQVLVDKDDNVWVAFTGAGEVTVFAGGTGTVIQRVADTEEQRVMQAADNAHIVTYDPDLGHVVLIDIGSQTIAFDFTLDDVSPDHQATEVRQIGMVGDKYFLPVQRKDDGRYEIIKVSEDDLIEVMPLSWPKAIRGTLTDEPGNMYAMAEFSQVFKFQVNSSVEAIYDLEAEGRLNAMALTDSGTVLHVASDNLLGSARVHTLDLSTGVATFINHESLEINAGDLVGVQKALVIDEPDTALEPPVTTPALFDATTFTGVKTVLTGKPGSVLNATDVTTPLGVATVNADGSWAISGAPLGAGPVALTFNGPGGATPDTVTNVIFSTTVASGVFVGTTFSLTGGFVKILLLDGSGVPVSTGTHVIRIKENNSAEYFNGTSLVPSNGLFLPLTHDEEGIWLYKFTPSVVGDYTVFFNEGTVFLNNEIVISDVEQTLDEVLTTLKQIEDPAEALLVATNIFDDSTEVGGFIVDRLAKIHRLLHIFTAKTKFVFPKIVEAVSTIMSQTFVKTGDTPLINFTIQNDAGEPQDLTGHTVKLTTRTQPGGDLIFSRTLDIDDAEAGKASVRLTAQDTSTSGSFQAEVEDVSPDGVVLSTQTFNFVVNPDLT